MIIGTRSAVAEATDIQTRGVSVRANSFDAGTRSVTAALTTESRVAVYDWRAGEVIEEVLLASGADLPDRVPMLDSHARYRVGDILGSVYPTERTGAGEILARFEFAEGDDSAESAMRKVRDGHIRDVSAGYRVRAWMDIEPGESAEAGGRTWTAGERRLRIVTGWTLIEGSLTAIGADEQAKIRAQSAKGTKTMNEALRRFLVARCGLSADATEEQARSVLASLSGELRTRADAIEAGEPFPAGQVDPPAGGGDDQGRSAGGADAPPTPPADPGRQAVDPEDLTRSIDAAVSTALERHEQRRATELAERRTAVEELGRQFNIGDDLVRQAIESGDTPDAASRRFLEAMTSGRDDGVSGAPYGIVRNAEAAMEPAVIRHALSRRFGIRAFTDRVEGETDAQRAERERIAERSDTVINDPLWLIAQRCLERSGINTAGMSRAHIAQAAMDQQRFGLIDTRAAVSPTHNFSVLLNQSIAAGVVSNFAEAPDFSEAFTRRVDLVDYRDNDRFREESMGSLRRHPSGGQAEHLPASDVLETYRATRFSGKIVFDAIDITNDNTGMLRDRIPKVGAAAARTVPDLVAALMLANAALDQDATALWHANHNNLDTDVLGGAGVAVLTTLVGNQLSEGAPLDLESAYLVVPHDLKPLAMQIVNSMEIRESLAANGTANVWKDQFEVRSSSRLGTNGVVDPATGTALSGTATNWWLFANPAQAPCIEVGFVGGRVPMIRSYQLTDGQYGIGIDVTLSCGVKALAFQSSAKSTGAG